jgi:hypothetical protein
MIIFEMFDKLKKKERFFEIWKMRGTPENLDRMEVFIARAMEEHPEFHYLWEKGDVFQLINDRQSEDPFFHMTIHSIVESQLEEKAPQELVFAFDHLLEKGASRHEALHSIGLILADEMLESMKTRKAFDLERYRGRLDKFKSI